ncbi:hypothetical protein ANO11243_048560 [Dothideomycetidae sp. 11243]|nr:hypothetical protein ANO11243_048560 [fungal sp. No.11243]
MASFVRPATRSLRTAANSQCRHYSAPVDGSLPAAKQRFVPTEGTYPKGFLLGSAHAGVKPSNTTREDVAIVASEELCTAVGFFTKNKFAAAPVRLCKDVLSKANRTGGVRGVVINSDCANAVTGTGGMEDAIKMSSVTDELFSSQGSDVIRTLVMSTGVIGQRLPIDKILSTIPKIKSKLGSSHDQWLGVAKAVMTTDTFPKLVTRQFTLPSDPSTTYTVAGFSKGAGMIHPNMATMLSVVCTDIKIDIDSLTEAGQEALRTSFNSISIDGDTSTNDSLAIFANGAAATGSSKGITSTESPDFKAFEKALRSVAIDLAKLVVRDGEGATKFVSIHVKGSDKATAAHVGRTIAVSPLVKTALYGKDANWGRILCAIGNVETDVFDPEKVSVSFGVPNTNGEGRLRLVEKGQPILPVDEELAKVILEEEDVDVYVDLGDAASSSTDEGGVIIYTCDFSHEYITINGDYRT